MIYYLDEDDRTRRPVGEFIKGRCHDIESFGKPDALVEALRKAQAGDVVLIDDHVPFFDVGPLLTRIADLRRNLRVIVHSGKPVEYKVRQAGATLVVRTCNFNGLLDAIGKPEMATP